MVCIPVLVAHVGHLLLVYKLVGLENLQRQLLRLNDLVALLDGGLGCLMIYVHLVCHLSVGFKLRVNGSLLRTRHSILSSGAHIVIQFCKCVLNPAFLTLPHQSLGQGELGRK